MGTRVWKLTSHRPEQKSQYAASTVNRKREVAERAKGWAQPLNLQEAKDAYRADSVSVWSRTSCLLFTPWLVRGVMGT